MAGIEILYKIYLDSDNSETKEKKPYYYMKKDCQKEITKETLKSFLVEDGYNPNYFELIKDFKISIKNVKDGINEEIQGNEGGEYTLKEDGAYKINLELIIDHTKEEARIKNEEENEKQNEKNEYELQFSNVNQISNELNDIKRQLNYLNKDIKNEQNEMIKCIKKNLYFNKKLLEFKEKKNQTMIGGAKKQESFNRNNTMTCINKSFNKFNTRMDSGEILEENNVNERKFWRIIFLYSLLKKKENLIQEEVKSNLYEEDYSYTQQFLNIYNIIKGKKQDIYIDLQLKQINEISNLKDGQYILHLRVNCVKENNDINFHFEGADFEYLKYSLNNLKDLIVRIQNLKLLIISSQNIQEIRENLKNLKEINIIYIDHSKISVREENYFIMELYNNLVNKEQTIKYALTNSAYLNKNYFICDIRKDMLCFDYKNINILESSQESKNLLCYEMMENNYHLIGRRKELNECLIKFKKESQKSICIFGTKGVGKKSFAKKVGFSAIERNIFNKAYYLEINAIDYTNLEMKVNMLIDEIYEYNTEGKILIIIYFNEQISRIYDLKEFIHNCDSNKKNNITISYLFTFTLDDTNIKECKNEFTNHIELTHFKKYEKEEKIITHFKELFNFCIKDKKNNIDDKLIKTINTQFDKLSNPQNEIKSFSSLELNTRSEQNLTLNSKESLSDEININETKEDKNIIQNNEIIEEDNINNKDVELKGAKINNIFLLAIYIDFLKDIDKDKHVDIEKIFNQLIIDDDIQIKKQMLLSIMKQEGKEYIYNLFLYLNKLICGIGKTSLKMILKDGKDETKINFIKHKLNGLIIVEYYMEEEIFRLDTSFKALIEEIINNDKNLIIINGIMKNYFECFRILLKEYEINQGFHACIKNNFWYSNDVEKLIRAKNPNLNLKFICDIDSNNIYNLVKIIKNTKEIYNNNETQKYIDDISISLPTLLYFTDNFYYEYLIIDIFEKLYENLKVKENTIRINELILRLGIFKYWVSKNPNFFEKSLKLAGLTDKININLNDDAKFEFYLSKIYDCIIKKEKYIEEYIYECKEILKKNSANINTINEDRLKDLKNEAIIKIDKDPKHKFFFLLSNPLNNKQFKTILNSNFYLTQKLLKKIPSNFGVEFKTFDGEQDLETLNAFLGCKENNAPININFVYLSNKSIKDELLKNKSHIKILILGYLGSEEILKDKEKINFNFIRNIIYISDNQKIPFNDDVKNYNNRSYYYYFELFFNQFVHDFISLITSKYEFMTIKEAFNKSKRNFVMKFKRLFESEDQAENDVSKNAQINKNKDYKEIIASIEDLIKIESGDNNEDVFEIENQDEEENLNNHQKVINDIYDEYEFEYNKIKSIYYRKNPFTEENESQIKKGKYKKYMQLPGIDHLSPKNFKYFVDKEIYGVNEEVSIIEELILKSEKNAVNIYGKDNVFDLGDELCKYFYMKGMFKNGIYIVSPRNIEEEKDSLIENIRLNNDNFKNEFSNILILLKLLNIRDKDIDISEINKLASFLKNEIKAHIVVCSEVEFTELNNSEKCDLNNLQKLKK